MEAIPHLIGFHPTDSIVAIVVRGRWIHLTARWDIQAIEEGHVEWIIHRLTQGEGEEGYRVLLTGYAKRDRACRALDIMVHHLGSRVLDAIVVEGDQWWFANEEIESTGRPVLHGVSQVLGNRDEAYKSRADLAASIAAPIGEREDEMIAHLEEALDSVSEDPREAGRQVVTQMGMWSDGAPLSDVDFLSAGLAMTTGTARDELWTIVTNETATQCLPFWKEVLRRTPSQVRVPALAVTGMIAWIAGQGAFMNICLEEAEFIDQEYPLVKMLSQISLASLHPDSWRAVADER